jgi:hypothetical protein
MSTIVSGLKNNFDIGFIYAILIDLHEIMLDVINYSVLLFLIPFIINEFVLYFKPGLYDKEKIFMLGLGYILIFTALANLFITICLMDMFWYCYLLETVSFFELTGIEVIPDLKFMIIRLLAFVKHSVYTFVFYNIGVIYFLKFFHRTLNLKLNIRLSNFVLFLYLYFIGCFVIDNMIQYFYFYGTQVAQLEVLILCEFFLLHQLYHDDELDEEI